MVLTVFVMIWANMQYRTKGVSWGRPLAGLCGLIALVLAVVAIVWTMGLGSSLEGNKARQKEEKYQHVAYKFLGREIAKQHPGAKILQISYPSGTGEAAMSMHKAQMDGLNEGLAGKATILREKELPAMMPGPYQSGARGGMPEGPGMMGEGMMLTAEKFDDIVEANAECNLVLSFVGLPQDVGAMKLWEKAKEGQAPALVLVNANTYELKKVIELKYISAILQSKPEAYDSQAPVPEDENAAFERRFMIITPENVAAWAAKYPQLFKPKGKDDEGDSEDGKESK
jgi:hypothetical protein